jgi:hypothetical protein
MGAEHRRRTSPAQGLAGARAARHSMRQHGIGRPGMAKGPELTEGQRAYEAKRAAKAGMSLEKWLADKERRARLDAAEAAKAEPPKEPAKQGWFHRFLDKAHKPLK